MKRREFLKTSTLAVGFVGAAGLVPQSAAEAKSAPPAIKPALAPEDVRSSAYLSQAQSDAFLPKLPAVTDPQAAIAPMPLAERRKRGIVPKKGFCSLRPGKIVSEGLTTGNGPMYIEETCDPYSDKIVFHHESLLMPWKRPLEAPKAGHILPELRRMLLDGKYQEAAEYAFKVMDEGPVKKNTFPHWTVAAMQMAIDIPKAETASNYLRTVDFESGEIATHWTDASGEWQRNSFASRSDDVVVQRLTAPKGQTVNARITVKKPDAPMRWWGTVTSGESDLHHDRTPEHLIVKGRLDPSADNSGYGAVVRVVRDSGTAKMDGDTLVIENAASVLLLTRIEWFAEYSDKKVDALCKALDAVKPDYDALIARHRPVLAEAFNRVSVDFGGASQYGMATEELLADQRSREGYCPGLLEAVFGMGRHWFIYTSGKYPTMVAEVNANINLQIAHAPQSDLREGMNAYFRWMESLAPDFRTNAKNIFGCRGTHYSLIPDKGMGVSYHYSYADSTKEIWPHPYWISAGGWCVRPFWDTYLCTGDRDFLKTHVVPVLKELALFYEDFLTVTDKNGNYVFAPSFSPENNPGNLNASCMMVINASMDIAVCREVLTNLIKACEVLGTEADGIKRWKAMLEKMPPYLVEPDGTLKEWSWPGLAERYAHRHVSHLYGVWPGDDIDPDRTPKLALAAMLADRKRVPERLAAHGRCHRALVGARLKDEYMVDTELRQLIEQGYVAPTMRCSHDPWAFPMPDAQGGIPAIMLEMLLYSRPGIIEVLPALPHTLTKGAIYGMLARTFARINKLSWDMDTRTVELTVTSFRDQDITLMARQGIEKIETSALKGAPQPGAANCTLHLPKGKAVDIRLKLGTHEPSAWVSQVTI